jgi:hypothetical protein
MAFSLRAIGHKCVNLTVLTPELSSLRLRPEYTRSMCAQPDPCDRLIQGNLCDDTEFVLRRRRHKFPSVRRSSHKAQ